MALFKNKRTGDVITATGPNEKHYAELPQWERLVAKPQPARQGNQPNTQQGA